MATIQQEAARGIIEIRESKSALHAFVMVYGNYDAKGERLYQSEDAKEVLLFQVWLQACAELGIAPPAPEHLR